MSYVQYGYRMRSPEEVQMDLQRFLGFTKADLEANRKGQLTARQQSRLTRELLGSCVWIAASMLLAAVWPMILPFVEGFAEDNTAQLVLRYLPLFLTGIGFYVIPWRVVADLIATRVDIAEGKGDVEMRGVNDHISLDERQKEWLGDDAEEGTAQSFEDWEDSQPLYHLRIDGVRFCASKQVVNSIEEGHRYRGFYLRHSQRLLSVEPVHDNVARPGEAVNGPALT
ncbi:MAG: hypothetical protein JST93_33590 [Acidobacteria bacterium]|nr:hypothetical protein [Acidobacteriota bacterium]